MLQPYKKFLCLAFALLSTQAYAQHTFTESTLNPYQQNFNSLSGDVGMVGNTVAGLPEVYAEAQFGSFTFRPGDGAGFAANDGSTAAANYYHFGYATGPDANDRSFGGIGGFLITPTAQIPGTGYVGIRFKNGTSGTTITNLEIQYAMEHWYNSTVNTSAKVSVSYLKGASGTVLNSLVNGTWTPVTALDVAAPSTATSVGGRDGNAASNRRVVNTTLNGIDLLPNQEVMIRWAYVLNSNTNGNGLSIDDVVVTPQTNVFYSKTTGNLNATATWGNLPNGTGTAPPNFTAANLTFYVRSESATAADERLSGTWTVSGPNSKIVVGTPAQPAAMRIGNSRNIVGTIDVGSGSTFFNNHPSISGFTLGTLAATSTVEYVTSGASHNVEARQYGNLTISGGSVNTDRTLNPKTLTGNTIVNGNLAITNGSNLVLGANNLTVLGSIVAPAVSPGTSYVVANGTGRLRVRVPRAANVSTPGATIIFPVGSSATSYTPITLQQTSTVSDDVFEVGVIDGVYTSYTPTTFAPGTQPVVSEVVKKTWLVSKEVPANPATVTMALQWNTGETTTDFLNAKAHVNHYTGGAWDKNTVSPGTTAGTIGNSFKATRTGISSFSPFSVSSRADGALPVELLSFGAKRTGANVSTAWATASEKNNDYFTVERSATGVEFKAIGTVKGAGMSSRQLNYAFEDKTPLQGVAYYRLRQTDTDGKTSFSPVVTVEGSFSTVRALAQPNPGTGRFEIALPASTITAAEVLTVVGTRLHVPISTANNRLSVDLNGQAAGIYLVRLQTSTGSQVVRLVKE